MDGWHYVARDSAELKADTVSISTLGWPCCAADAQIHLAGPSELFKIQTPV
jgi:hypothetical protein